MVPKAGLYQRGLLKSLMAWAIPAPRLAIRTERHSRLFVSLCGFPYQFVGFPNTCLTLARGKAQGLGMPRRERGVVEVASQGTGGPS